MSQTPLPLYCTFQLTTNYSNDTANYNYTNSGAPLTGPPDWTAACTNYVPPPWINVSGFYTSPVFSSSWTVSATGGTGKILGIYFTLNAQYGANDETNPRKSIIVILESGGGTFTSGFSYTLNPPLVCFVKGTRILTQSGCKAIEDLHPTDNVMTADNRFIAFRLKKIHVEKADSESAPYCIETHAFGKNMPAAPLHLSPTHKVQLRKGVWISPERAALVNSKVYQYGIGEPVTYYHIACDDYLRDNILAEGIVVETLATNLNYDGPKPIYTWSKTLGGFTRRTKTMSQKKV